MISGEMPVWSDDFCCVNKHFIKETTHFFETYKKVQNKEVKIGEWHGAAKAKDAFTRSCEMYQAKK